MKNLFFIITFFCIFSLPVSSEILVFKDCKSKDYEFEKTGIKLI